MSRRWAVLDVGGNTVRLLVANLRERGWHEVLDESRMTRLGRALLSGGPPDAGALDGTLAAVREFSSRAEALGAERLECVVTAALRQRKGAPEALEAISLAAGAEALLLSGEQEARLTYAGALAGTAPAEGSRGVVDVGGGSTEIAVGRTAARPDLVLSLALGARRGSEAFLHHDPPTESEVRALRTRVAEVAGCEAPDLLARADRLVGVGGTVVAAGELALGPGTRAAGHTLGTDAPADQIASLAIQTRAALRQTLLQDPERAEVLVAGCVILHELLRMSDKSGIVVSYGGVRHGLLLEAIRLGPGAAWVGALR